VSPPLCLYLHEFHLTQKFEQGQNQKFLGSYDRPREYCLLLGPCVWPVDASACGGIVALARFLRLYDASCSNLAMPLLLYLHRYDNKRISQLNNCTVSWKSEWTWVISKDFVYKIPKMKKSKLLFDMYSYISIFSSPWVQHPNSFTKFVCWSLAISWISVLNSFKPLPEFWFNLLTAISSPFGSCPWNSFSPC
jgi:hypothetical protein